eukprot:1152623-Pyramimonas_sp.AAC.1
MNAAFWGGHWAPRSRRARPSFRSTRSKLYSVVFQSTGATSSGPALGAGGNGAPASQALLVSLFSQLQRNPRRPQ